VTPFLPGDSLLFAVGTICALGSLQIEIIYPLLLSAAILGDNMNYWIGRRVGPGIFKRDDVRLFNRRHLDRAHAFYEKHGVKTIIIARFLPILRTFSPFVAGIGAMRYRRFVLFDVIGGFVWVTPFMFSGYFFGNIPVVKRNFSLVIIAIIVVSLAPAFIEVLRHHRQARAAAR